MNKIKKTILTLVALLALTTGAWAADTYTVTFAANGNTKTVENVTLPKNFQCSYNNADGDLDLILKELYGWTGDSSETICANWSTPKSSDANKVVAGKNGNDHYITIDNVFEGTVTITGDYIVDLELTQYSLEISIAAPASSGPKVDWDKDKKTGTFTMPGGNVTLEPEYYPQAALTAAPTAINDVPATTDGAIVKAGTVKNIGETTTAQGTVMYYVSQTALDDAALLALAADQWTADVPTAEKLAQGKAYVYYYVRGNDSDTDEENFSDGDILAANALTVTIAAEPTKVTMAVNDKTMGTAEVCGQSKVEWTADTWKGWTADTKVYTVDDITMTSSQSGHIREYISEDKYNNSLFFFVRKMVNDATVTFSTTGDPFSRIEFTMIGDYSQYNPDIIPNDNWTFEGKSAVWEGEATKSLTLQSCSTNVSKITFFKGAIPDGVTINTDGTFTVAKTATVTLKATPAEGYKFLYWEDDQTNTNPVREVTIESGMADMTYKAVFAEITYNVTFAEGTDPNEWSASPAADVKKGQTVTVTYTGSKKVIGVKAEKKKSVTEGKTLAEATVGMLVGSDGKTYAAADKNNLPEGVTAVALVCYVSDGHGLALALADESEKMTWKSANSTCSGKTPAVTGCTWKLATKDEWNNMINAAGGFSALRDGFSSVGGTNMLSGSDDYYWSSTTTGYDCAWSCTFSTGNWTDDYADDYTTDYVRACLAF